MTYSIVARDPSNGDLGVAVQTHQPAVGGIVPWVIGGLGAVATQSFANINFGPQLLALLQTGLDPGPALNAVLAADEMPSRRQVAVIAAKGDPAVHTGSECIPHAGHRTGEHFSVQANMMLTDRVPAAMAEAFQASAGLLAVRMLRALEAAQAEGGDIRGSQSAAILVRAAGPLSNTWDLRVDNDPQPLAKLGELVNIRLAAAMVAGDAAGQPAEALLERFREASALAPSDELTFWFAVRTLAAMGDIERAAELLRPVFERAPQWKELLFRLDTPEARALQAFFTR